MTATASAPAAAPPGRAAPPPPPERARLLDLGDLAYALHALVPSSWLFALARLRGNLTWALRPGVRAVVRRNMTAVLNGRAAPADIAHLARRFFVNQQLQNLLVMLAPRMSDAELEKIAPIEGLEKLERVVAAGRGGILLGSHVNSVSLFVAIVLLRRKGYDVRVAMPTPKDPWRQTRLRRWLDQGAGRAGLREQLGAFHAQFNVRPIVERLAAGTVVAMTGDGWHSAAFVEVDFLGRSLPFTTGAISLARSTGATVIPTFAVGEPPLALRIVLEEPFAVPKTRDGRRDVREAVAAYARRVEHHVLTNAPGWQHWLVPDLLNTLATWPSRPLSARYEL